MTRTVIDLFLATNSRSDQRSFRVVQTNSSKSRRSNILGSKQTRKATYQGSKDPQEVITDVQLLALMANPPKPEPVQGGFLKSLTGGQNHQRLLAQQVVTWQDDETVTQCPFCESLFISTFPNLQASIQLFKSKASLSALWTSSL